MPPGERPSRARNPYYPWPWPTAEGLDIRFSVILAVTAVLTPWRARDADPGVRADPR
jgi:hypothetical protein